MSVVLTHGDLAALGIGHEPWCPHGKAESARLKEECWCEFDARAERARRLVDRIVQRAEAAAWEKGWRQRSTECGVMPAVIPPNPYGEDR